MKDVSIVKGNNIIRLDNEIVNKNVIDYNNNLSVFQKKLVFKLLIAFKNGQDLNGIHWTEIIENVELTGNYTAAEKKSFITNCGTAMFDFYTDEDNFESYTLFSSIGLKYNKLTYKLNSELIILLSEIPEMNYFLLNYNNIKHFKFKYSIPIYILINKELSANSTKIKLFNFDVAELRDHLGIGNTKYARYDSFLDKVVKPALIEINKYTDIAVVGEVSNYSGKIKLCWKIPYKNRIGIGGVYRKQTTKEYMELKAEKRKK